MKNKKKTTLKAKRTQAKPIKTTRSTKKSNAAADPSSTQQNSQANLKVTDKWIKCVSLGGNIHATAILAPNMIEHARKLHHYGKVHATVLGEAMMGGLLLASSYKQGERVSLVVHGDGFLSQAVADADPSGFARGFVNVREGVFPEASDQVVWENGRLTVVRLKQYEKEPYSGTVPCVTGHLPKDLTYYLSQSEQIPSAVGIAVNASDSGEILSAGAFLVQIMAGATDEEVDAIEANIQHMQSLASQVSENKEPTLILGQIFNEMTFTILEEKPLRFQCTCSRERVVRALEMMGLAELKDMREKDKGAEVRCDFCGKEFAFDKADLNKLISKY